LLPSNAKEGRWRAQNRHRTSRIGRIDSFSSGVAPGERAVDWNHLEAFRCARLGWHERTPGAPARAALVDRGLLIGAKDAPLRIAFPLGESERLFPHLCAPAGVTMALDLSPEVDDDASTTRYVITAACSPCASRPTWCTPLKTLASL
jgi:hypothetical protein